MFQHAVTRLPGRNFAYGVTGGDSGVPDWRRAVRQHERYCRVLADMGVEVEVLEPEPGFPDSTFVEDAAVLVDDVAVLTRPGEISRRGEPDCMEHVLKQYGKKVVRIQPPGKVEGGDIVRAGDLFFIGLSERTNRAGAVQVGACLSGLGYASRIVDVAAPPHLSTGLTYAGDDTLIMIEQYAFNTAFRDFKKIVMDSESAYAANCLRVNGSLVVPEGYGRALRKLERVNAELVELDVSEFKKMDGGLTCLSLRFS